MSDTPIYDSLTGAYTRALFHDQLHAEVERVRRYGQTCSLLVFGLDHFKSVNDAFGHARGDEVLVEVARRVQQEIRASDRLGYLATHQGAYGQAMPFFAESLKLYRTEADRQLLTSVLAGCAELRRAQGQFEPAAAYWHMSRRTPSRRSAHLSPL